MNDFKHMVMGFTAIMCALIVCMSAVEIATLLSQAQVCEEERQEKSKGWTPRSIPVCDKELWERIKDGCPDDSQHLETEGERE